MLPSGDVSQAGGYLQTQMPCIHVEVPVFAGTANAPLFDMAPETMGSTRDCGHPGI